MVDINYDQLSKALNISMEYARYGITQRNMRLREYDGLHYLQIPHNFRGHDEGEVILLPSYRIIKGYDKTRRALVAKSALRKHMGGDIVAEEKMDGYNVRVFMVNDMVLAATRSGVICPLTTHIINNLYPDIKEFFDDNNDLVICGEVVGRCNPYIMVDYPEVDGIGFFVFGMQESNTGKSLANPQWRRLANKYNLRTVPLLAEFKVKNLRKLFPLVNDLSRRKREGIVFKSKTGRYEPVKYTTSYCNTGNLSSAFGLLFDFDPHFIFRRLIREGFQAVEFNESAKDMKKRAERIGENILYPMVELIKKVNAGKDVYLDFPVFVTDLKVISRFTDLMKTERVDIDVVDISGRDDGYMVTLRRNFRPVRDKIKAYLEGEFCGD